MCRSLVNLSLVTNVVTPRVFPVQNDSIDLGEGPSIPLGHEHLRRISRTTRHPMWMKDYATLSKGVKYPLANTLSYNNISAIYHKYLSKFENLVEPQTLKQASQDHRWIQAMKLEI